MTQAQDFGRARADVREPETRAGSARQPSAVVSINALRSISSWGVFATHKPIVRAAWFLMPCALIYGFEGGPGAPKIVAVVTLVVLCVLAVLFTIAKLELPKAQLERERRLSDLPFVVERYWETIGGSGLRAWRLEINFRDEASMVRVLEAVYWLRREELQAYFEGSRKLIIVRARQSSKKTTLLPDDNRELVRWFEWFVDVLLLPLNVRYPIARVRLSAV